MQAKRCDLCNSFYLPLMTEEKIKLEILKENTFNPIDVCPGCQTKILNLSSSKKLKVKRKNNWSPEMRAAASERMRKRFAPGQPAKNWKVKGKVLGTITSSSGKITEVM